MTKTEFNEAFGYYPFSSTGEPGGGKSRPKPKKGTRGRKSVKKAQIGSESINPYSKMSEADHQQLLVQWLEMTGLYFEVSINGLYLPNPHPKGSRAWIVQSRSNITVLKKLKRQGWKKGQADLKVFLNQIEINIELKKIGGRPTPEQKATQILFDEFPYADYVIVEGWIAAKEIIEKYRVFNK